MGSVFISYRRDDSQGFAGRLEDDLSERLGDEWVFRDREIPAGTDFVEHLQAHLDRAAVVLVVIGPAWSAIRGADGRRRLDAPDDWVRREIERALARNVPLVPVLVGGARMPAAAALPAGIAALSRRQALALDDAHWARDLDELLAQLGRLSPPLARQLARRSASRQASPPGPPRQPLHAPRWATSLLRWLGGRLGRLAGLLALAAVAYVLIRALGGHEANQMLDRVIATSREQWRLLMR